MDTTLSKEEKVEIKQRFANDPIFKAINNIVTDITYQFNDFPLATEDIYCKVMDVIDTIRETEGSRECTIFMDSLYKRLYNTIHHHLSTATILYIASALLSTSRQPTALKYAMALQLQIDDPGFSNTRLLLHKTQEAFDLYLDQPTTEQWQQYYLSENYVCDQITDAINKIRNFNYIDMEKLEEYGLISYEKFITEFRLAAEADAPTLAAFLRKYEKLGILNFHNDSKKNILDKLQAYFPTMRRYSYGNVTAAF